MPFSAAPHYPPRSDTPVGLREECVSVFV